MTEHLGGVAGPPPRRPEPGGRVVVWPWAIGCTLAGVAAGAAWRLLVPVLIDPADQERAVARDGVFALICLVTGLLVGAALARVGATDWRRLVVVLSCSLAGSGVAWGTGLLLGIPTLGATGAPLLWPVATSATAFVSILVGGLGGSGAEHPWPAGPGEQGSAAAGYPGGPALGQPQQVLGAQLHVQPPTPGAHQDGLVREGPGVQHGGQWPPLPERADPADDVPR